MSSHWTKEEVEIARLLWNQGAPDSEYRARIGKTRNAYMNRTNKIRYGYSGRSVIMPTAGRVEVSEAALEDRNRRLLARYQMDLTGIICGDPPFPATPSQRAIL